MKIKSASYEEQQPGYPVLRIVFTDDKPDGIVLAEDAYRYHLRGWPGVYIGPALEDVLPPAGIEGNQLRGVSVDPDVIKLAKRFHADLAGESFEPKTLDVQAILGAE